MDRENMMLILDRIKKCFIALSRLVYPAVCLICNEKLDLRDNFLCPKCAAKLTRLVHPLCFRCARELPPYGCRHSLCRICRHTKTYYDRGISILRYESETKRLLRQVKFKKKSWYLKALRPFLEKVRLPRPISEYDIILPVPLDRVREREREFNQSHIIATLLKGQSAGPPIVQALKKTKRTSPQSRLDRQSRLRNLSGAFSLKRRFSVVGKKILLVDDIMTTGATLNECAKSLKEKGAERIDFFTLAKAVSVFE